MTLRKKFKKSARMTDKRAQKLAKGAIFLAMAALFIGMLTNAPANAVTELQIHSSGND